METEDFFDGLPVEPEAVPVEQVAETPVAEAAPETPAEPEPQAEAKPEPKPEPGHVPITALLDEREKRKELERQLREYQAQQQQPQAPDPNVDPYAYQQHLMQQVQQQVLDTRLNMSEVAARRHYGAELTDQAKAWALEKFQSSPAFQAEVIGSPDPYDYAIQAYQKEQIASQVSADDFKAFQAWKAAQAQIAAATPAAQPVQPIPRSLASAPSAGGAREVVPDEEEAFRSAIP